MIAFTIPVITSFMQTMIEKTTGFFHNPKHFLQYFEVDFLLLNLPHPIQWMIKVVLF